MLTFSILFLLFLYIILFCFEGKNLEIGLRKAGLLSFVRELDGNEEEQYEMYLKDVSMYARGKLWHIYIKCIFILNYVVLILVSLSIPLTSLR